MDDVLTGCTLKESLICSSDLNFFLEKKGVSLVLTPVRQPPSQVFGDAINLPKMLSFFFAYLECLLDNEAFNKYNGL